MFKGRSHQLRPKAHILDDPLGNPNNGLKVLFGPPYGHVKGRSRRLRPKAHILDDPLGNPNDGLKVLFGPPFGGNFLVVYRGIRDLFRAPGAIGWP